ncbi:[NiFe]-hydrogenase assembly chaperone HybE [Stappia sp. BW2]|uniref:[NiFe]-hydrogenase assembly chaperone HybE n=1 Tax=Stappia sp. BW2 TaxID=2592622 RepID=UPI001396CAF1|nr:[NiFe]-hydrogenase assembly chaperone HybE [Stappia sp. BW2]
MSNATAITNRLEACFRQVHAERMTGIPILNGKLGVRAVGIAPWNGFWFGVLITPWFMNLVLLPQEADEEIIRSGEKRLFAFPAGPFEFIRGHEDGLGPFWMCSLFSPVFEFEEMETAEATAIAALAGLMEGVQVDEDRDMQRIWQGDLPEAVDLEGEHTAAGQEEAGAAEDAGKAPVAAELSRRKLLTGQLRDSSR